MAVLPVMNFGGALQWGRSGFARYRRILLQPYRHLTGAPTAEQIEQATNSVINTVRAL